MSKTLAYLQDLKKAGRGIAVLTCYDYPTARVQDEAGMDVIFVGDSLGTNALGYEHEREVTMADMVHHLRAVRRGVREAYLLVDLPYMTYETPEAALDNARTLIGHGADAVKLEGPRPEIVRHLVGSGIEVWGHLGLNPQLHEKKGLHAKTAAAAVELLQDALALQEAGAALLVLELVPEEVGRLVTERLTIPTIGIGAGRYTDGQVLIVHDLLGISPFMLRHVTKYEDLNARSLEAIGRYVGDVRQRRFPLEQNVRHLSEQEQAALEQMRVAR